MKRYLFFAVVALFVLVFVAGCMRPEGQTPAVQNYGAVVVEKAEGGYVVEVTKDLGVVEVDFEGVIPKDAFKTSSENLLLYKVMNGKTIVAVASTKGVLKEKEEVIKVSYDNVEISAVRTTPAINIVKASVESWEEYQNDPNARLLGDSRGKDGYRDSEVEIHDFVRFVKAYGEDGEYNPEFDFTDGSKLPLKAKDKNGELFFAIVQATDNKVDPYDFYVFAYNYGMVVNRDPVIESVKVGDEDVTEKVKAGETIYKPAGSYEVKVGIKDYDGNEIVNENVSVKNFDLNSGNREVPVTITAKDNFGGELNKSFTVKLQAVQILWRYVNSNESAAEKDIVLLGDDTANLIGTIYLGEKSWENVSKYNFTVFNGDVAIATSNELTEPASYIKAVVDNAGIKFEVYDEKNNKLDSFEATGLNWTTPGGSVITAKINIFTPDDLVHPNPNWSGQGEFKVYYFKKPTPGPLSFKLTDDTQNATVVTTGKLWVNGDKHKYLKVYVKVSGVKDLTIDKFVFNFSVGGGVEVPISKVVVDPAEALKPVDIDGVIYYYFAADEATLTFDLSEIVDELGSLSDEISTTFERYDVFSNDINGNNGSNGSNKIGSADFEIEGKNTLYFDNKAPKIKGLLNRYLTPNDKVWFKFVNEAGEVFEDANEVSAKVTLYLGNEDPANKTINNEAASAEFARVDDNEWDATIAFADWPKLKSIDKTYFCVKATVSDEFGNKSYTNLYCYTTEGSRMYVDTYVNRADVGWDFTGKHIDEDTDPASTYTSWSATGTFDMKPERSGIEKYQFFVKTDKGDFVNATSVDQKPADGEDFHNGILYTPKISFKDVPYTEGVLATVTFLVWDKEGNVTESKEPFVKEFIVDTKASTIATFDGNTLSNSGSNGAKIVYDDASVVNSSLEVEYSTENVYKVYAKVYADIEIGDMDYSKTPYIPNETGVIRSNMLMSKKFDKALDLVNDLDLVVEDVPATIVFTLVDYAGNESTAMVAWKSLTTKLKTIFADWNKTKLELNAGTLSAENDPGFDILNYDPQPFGVVGPKSDEGDVNVNDSDGRLSTNGGLSFTFYATTTSKDADVYIKDYDGNYTQDGTNNTYNFRIAKDGKVKKVTITLKNNTDDDIDFEDVKGEIAVELLSSAAGVDELKKVATVTFHILPDLELDPESPDFAATIQIDKVTSDATLIIEMVNKDKEKYLGEATFVQNKYLSIWDASDLTSPVEVYSLKNLMGEGFEFTLKLATGTYSIYKDYYYVSISKEGARYMLKGTDGEHGKRIYETNNHVLEQIKAKVEPVE